jgi:NTP pyrophosphatase (non-canonical NTP hydrolase)
MQYADIIEAELSDTESDFMYSFDLFQEHIHALCVQAGWWTDPHTKEDITKNPYAIATKIGLAHSEISEALEGYRKNKNDDHLKDRQAVEVELADAVIRIMDLAGVLKLDLAGAIVAKNKYNQKRSDHKMENRQKAGGKRF